MITNFDKLPAALLGIDVQLQSFLGVALSAAKKAREIHLKYNQQSYIVDKKELNDIVTTVDLEAENAIISEILLAFPSHGIKSEETSPQESQKPYQWVIDSLDGTINYTAGLPFYSVSVALQKDGLTILGVIVAGELDDLFIALRDHGAFKNYLPIAVSNNTALGDSVVSFMLTSHYKDDQKDKILNIVSNVSPQVRGLRLLVSQALELAYIASGRLDGHICIKSRGFSAAAGVLLIQEAGGKVTDLDGVDFSNDSRSLLASNTLLHEMLVKSCDLE